MIGGNITCYLKLKSDTENEIGESIPKLKDYMSLKGWLDFMSETSERTNFNTKLNESTHVFLCDYSQIDKGIRDLVFIDNNNKEYDILYIDNPMNLNKHLEIFLKYVGD